MARGLFWRRRRGSRIGLALGGGGAKGLSHVLMLEALDELGVKPCCVAGTSIGAVAGVIYCAGRTGREMREWIARHTIGRDEKWSEVLARRESLLKWFGFVAPNFDGGGLLQTQGFLDVIFETTTARTFAELDIPLKVVAADFWSREQVILESGDLVSAVQASMALPGAFAPVVRDGHVLVDGGAVNPVPFDLLPADCDVTVAVDVLGRRTAGRDQLPSLADAVFNTFQIMEKTIIHEKLLHSRPHIYIEPEIADVRVLEFHKAELVFEQAQPAKEQLKRELAAALE